VDGYARAQIVRLLAEYPKTRVVPDDLKQEIAQVLSKDFFVFWYGYPERIDLVKSRILTGTSLKEFAESRNFPVDQVSKWEQYFKTDFEVLRGRDSLFPLPSRRGSLEGAL
jgi:hypothetical protein